LELGRNVEVSGLLGFLLKERGDGERNSTEEWGTTGRAFQAIRPTTVATALRVAVRVWGLRVARIAGDGTRDSGN